MPLNKITETKKEFKYFFKSGKSKQTLILSKKHKKLIEIKGISVDENDIEFITEALIFIQSEIKKLKTKG